MKEANNIPPFFVGQEVVCIKDHSWGVVKKGQEYKVLAIKQSPCCGSWRVDVGIYNPAGGSRCKCGHVIYTTTCWIGAVLFAPKDQFKAISFTKVLETELASVN